MVNVRTGELVSIEFRPTTPSKHAIVVWRLSAEDVLASDEINLLSARTRTRFVQNLPSDVQLEAAELLQDAAAELSSREQPPVREAARAISGSDVIFEDPVPHGEPVDGEAILDVIAQTLTTYVVLPKGAAEAIALWVVVTYVYDLFAVSPILAIVSPEKRCGKTTLLSLLSLLVAHPLPASNITPAALFRTVEKYRPTVLIDEADSFFKDNDELRGIVNSGHTKATAFVIRTVGDAFEPKRFHTFCPKAFAAIGKMPETILDRSIVVAMRRRIKTERVTRIRIDHLRNELAELVAKIARWARDHADELRGLDPDVPGELNDREADSWRPLFAVAVAVGGAWTTKARDSALELSGLESDDVGPSVQLLADLRTLFREREVSRLPTAEVVEYLVKLDDRPWPAWNRGRPIAPPQLATLLRRFKIKPKALRSPSHVFKGYEEAQFLDAWSRYLPPERLHRLHDAHATLSANGATASMTDSGNSVSRCDDSEVTAVTEQTELLDARMLGEPAQPQPGTLAYPCAQCGRARFRNPGTICFTCRRHP